MGSQHCLELSPLETTELVIVQQYGVGNIVAGLDRRRSNSRSISNMGPNSVARIALRIVVRNTNLPQTETGDGI
jgi:hypothetical protein